MTIRIYLISLLILMTHFAHAQSPTMRRGSYVGITGGVGMAWLAGQHNYGLENLSGTPETAYSGGAIGGVTLKGGHTIHGEVVFAFQKQRYQDVRYVPGMGNTREALIGKNLDFIYLRFPLTYRRVMGIKNGDTDIGDSKFFWGAGVEMAAMYDVNLDYTINGVSDDRFVFNGTFNDKIKFPPANDIELFNSMDIAMTGSVGWERFLTEHLVFQTELKGAVSLLDINHEKWRIPNDMGIYTPSRHLMLNLKCSVIYYVSKVKRLDVY